MNIEKCVEPPAIGGMLIAYEDHIAEMERLTTILAEASLVMLAERDEAWQVGVDQMREACIAAVEEVDGGRAVLVFRRNVISALRRVQP